jgi:hypothetical protein
MFTVIVACAGAVVVGKGVNVTGTTMPGLALRDPLVCRNPRDEEVAAGSEASPRAASRSR